MLTPKHELVVNQEQKELFLRPEGALRGSVPNPCISLSEIVSGAEFMRWEINI